MKRRFTKMHGCGNDYVYFNCFEEQIEDPSQLSIALADRHFGVGGDGIIMICPSEVADAKMRIFNADGSEAKMCGNGIRCVGQYLYNHQMVEGETLHIDTLSGIKEIKICPPINGKKQVQVDMGAPILEPKAIPVGLDGEQVVDRAVEIEDKKYQITCVSMGNPHCVVFVENVVDLPLEVIGPKFEKHPLFPEQVNTEFVRVIDRNHLEMRVWERGSGETFACGTGACATVVAAALNGYVNKNEDVIVHLRGGDLTIKYTDETVYMTGEAETVFEGEIDA